MDLNEAIKHSDEIASTCNNVKCSYEHRQLAEWLRLLKRMGDDMLTMRYLIKLKHPEAFERIKEILMAYEKDN